MTTAASGASAGFMAGMSTGNPYAAVAGLVIGGFMGGKAEKKEQKALAKAIQYQSKQLLQQMSQVQADIWRQQGVEVNNTETAINYVKYSTGQQKADISVQTASADAIGASAAAAYADAETKSQQAQAQVMRQFDNTNENLTQSLYSALNKSAVATKDMTNYFKSQDTRKQENMEAYMGLAKAGGSAYAKGMFDGMMPKGEFTKGTSPNEPAYANMAWSKS